MDYFFRYATSVYGQRVLLGANWDLFWWFVGAGGLFIVLHALSVPFVRRRQTGALAPQTGAVQGGRVLRHLATERLFHWVLAGSVLTLIVTSFAPILGWDINWVPVHWITGVVLIVVILFHIVRAVVSLDLWSMMPDRKDMANALRAAAFVSGSSGEAPGKPGKYPLAQKLYHWGIAFWLLVLIVTGGLMLAKIDTTFWQRNPYFLSESTWGIVYAIHGFFALGLITLVMMHIYFALRPDKIFLLRSMILGWMTRREYLAEHDPERWAGEGAGQREPATPVHGAPARR